MKLSRIFTSFWLFGLLNNVLYVVILSAAVDLVGPLVPKAVVLLANILPAFTIKITAPFFIHLIDYKYRIWILIVLSTLGMILVSSATLELTIFGIILASISSGLGEITFLQLTHFYEDSALKGWSSGTGGAGLIGSGLFLLLTTILQINVRLVLLSFTIYPLGFLYYFKLPKLQQYERIDVVDNIGDSAKHTHILRTINKLKTLIIPYMIPLTTVYFAEYLINQSIAPTLLFPIEKLPFKQYRDVYVTYGTLYQLGVFISRSSSSIIRIRKLYLPSMLQGLNVLILLLQSIYFFIPSVYIIMIIIFYEGLLGGVSYVNTFHLIIDEIDNDNREFALGAVSMSDSGGIVMSAIVGMFLEKSLCQYQVHHGRDWCELN